ncbi:sugar ABC transporter substrate-binding protein [Castellaniella sp.]|uniref:sugar ABC transporter substrate-binding protein n=1 Tax=Castellaniella sp. TaxID=1955812 RepID=UPI00356A841A
MNGTKGMKILATSLLAASAMMLAPASHAQSDKYKIFLSMSYIGNDWQAEATNMIKAMAKTPELRDKVDLEIQVAGADAQKQIQQINAMIQAGANAIVVYPISPTALNQVIKRACSKDIQVFAYDGEVTEPCAHNIHIDQKEAGVATAEWLVDQMGGKGNIVMITGVPGTSVDKLRTEGAKSVFAQHPEIKVVNESPGMWSQAVARTELTKIMAVRDWDDIDGLWMQVGCYTANAMQLEADRKPEDLLPCAGEGSNGGRIQMLPPDTQLEGASGAYAPLGAPRFSYASVPYSGALALKLAVEALDGKAVPQEVILPLPRITNETVKLCQNGTWKEMDDGCNVFMPAIVKNPGWFASIYSPETRNLGLEAALNGEPDQE